MRAREAKPVTVEQLNDVLGRLVSERERLRTSGAATHELEVNRLAIGRTQRDLADRLIARHTNGDARPTPKARRRRARMEENRRASGLTAVVLVGGKGTRLRPLTETTPKPMLPLLGRPLLEYTFDQLRHAGVRRVVLASGYLPTQIEAYFGRNADGVALEYCVEPTPLGTAGGIRFAAEQLDETFLALNGDTLRDVDLRPLVRFHRKRGARATILLTRVADPSRYGLVDVDARGRVRGFREKPPPGEIETDLVNAGVYVLEPDVLDLVQPGKPVSIERDVFPLLAEEGSLYALPLDGYWLDVGTPESYLQAHFDLLARAAEMRVDAAASVAGGARVVPPAVVSPGASVGIGATIGPFAYVGEGASVGDYAVVERAVLLPNATLDARAAARSSIVAPAAVLAA